MISPRRLLDHESDSFELKALRAALTDHGSAQALERALDGLTNASIAAAAAPTLKYGKLLLALKGVSAGVAIGACTLGVLAQVQSNRRAGAPPTVAGAPPTVAGAPPTMAGAPASKPALAPKLDAAEVHIDQQAAVLPESSVAHFATAAPLALRAAPTSVLPRVDQGGIAAPSAVAANHGAAESDTPSPLAREVALLDAARKQLASGNMNEALSLLQRRERELRNPILGPEATLIRVEALLGRGDRAQARAVGNEFLSHTPRGAHAALLRQLLDKP